MSNPAIALYEHWNSILHLIGGVETAYGDGTCGIHRDHRGWISWGANKYCFDERFHLTPDGRFCFRDNFQSPGWGNGESGSAKRALLECHVPFLTNGNSGPSYQDRAWDVAEQPQVRPRDHYNSVWRDFNDHLKPRPYVLEKAMSLSWIGSTWMQLVETEEFGWTIELAEPPETLPSHLRLSSDAVQGAWDHGVRLREYRYRRLENEAYWTAHPEARPVRRVSEPHIRVGSEVIEDEDEIITHLAAFFTINEPLSNIEALEALEDSHGN